MSAPLIPLESNPDVMNKFLQSVGVPSKWQIVDVMSLDTELLCLVPKPVLAVLLLFPISKTYEQYKQEEENEILSKGQNVSSKVFFMRQSISNACGTIALVHSVANNTNIIELNDGQLKSFIKEAIGLDPAAKGALFEKNSGILEAHVESSQEGQTAPNSDDPVNYHFVAFVHKDGALYELDGRKPFPVNHGSSSEDTLLEDAAKICRNFMARDPQEVHFTVLALTAST